ncbi:MAG: putative manganese transporter [Lachnospiraceae bacterium]|nr:putative manganese transporter [Lachnospiraceae bacterium]
MILLEAFLDALKDSAVMLPFLYVAFAIMELVEHHGAMKMQRILSRGRAEGPLLGALLGCVPQCGFSVMAVNLFSAGVISLGTLLAVFLSTSDEAVLILIGNLSAGSEVLRLLGVKIAIGVIAGYGIDLYLKWKNRGKDRTVIIEHTCDCDEEDSVWLSALRHTLRLFLFLLIFTTVINLVIDGVGQDSLQRLCMGNTVLQPWIAALVGLIPNCGASVMITELYLAGGITFGSAVGGLCSSAGVGLAVLFRSGHRRIRDNLKIVGLLYVISAVAGTLIQAFWA